MSWDNFDVLCSVQNEQIQINLENKAMAGIQVAVAEGKGLREALSCVLDQITQENNWLTVIGVLQDQPMILDPAVDGIFYRKCPKLLLEEFVAGENGVFAKFLDRVNEDGRETGLDTGDIRLMHMVIDSLVALGQNDRLKNVIKTFQGVCEIKSESGLLPGSVYKKLVAMKMIQSPSQVGVVVPKTQPARHLEPKARKSFEGKKIVDACPAQPPNGVALPDKSLAAQLAGLVN